MLSTIKELIFQEYFVDKKGLSFKLIETAIEATCKEAKFEAEHEEYVVFKFDETTNLFPFYSDIKKAKKMCDYIIFYKKEYKNEITVFAVICNLKSGKKDDSSDQIHAGHIFAKFIFDTAKRLNPPQFENVKLCFVRVLFHNIKTIGNNINYRDQGIINNEGGVIYIKSSDTFKFEHWCRKDKPWIYSTENTYQKNLKVK